MIQCACCQRHVRRGETSCPFCGSAVRGSVGRALQALASSATMVVLAACYGPALDKGDTSCDSGSCVTDMDEDGYGSDEDCDDTDAAINPGVFEDCADAIDNDCDTLVDMDDSDCVAP